MCAKSTRVLCNVQQKEKKIDVCTLVPNTIVPAYLEQAYRHPIVSPITLPDKSQGHHSTKEIAEDCKGLRPH